MEKKKALIYLVAFSFSIALFLLMSFLAYNNASNMIDDELEGRYSSISNIDEMESLFYSQTLLVAQQFSGVDPIPMSTFQSYAGSFLDLYKEEYDKASTAEEIDYTFQIESEYSKYIDMFAQLQSFYPEVGLGHEDAYIYYKISLSPQTSSVFSALQDYRSYIEGSVLKEKETFVSKTQYAIMILFLLFLILSIALFVISNTLINRHIAPMKSLLNDQQKFEKMKSDFISTVSHEFKTPLTSIIMGADLLQNPLLGELSEDQQDLVYTIKEDSISLTNLVNNLLQLSKFDSSEVSYSFNREDIVELIEQSAAQFSHITAKTGIAVKYDFADSLPPVNADSEKIVWVLNNILSNAFKYSNAGDEITIKAFQNIDDHIIVQIADMGPGIPPQYYEKIFEKYFQVNESDIELGGTGLGLAISKEIISAHGGKIWCSANAPKGSIFSFTVPVLNTMNLDIKR